MNEFNPTFILYDDEVYYYYHVSYRNKLIYDSRVDDNIFYDLEMLHRDAEIKIDKIISNLIKNEIPYIDGVDISFDWDFL